jgi:sugar phosphate isomerase/epimerase
MRRRQFLHQLACVTSATAAFQAFPSCADEAKSSPFPIAIFAKVLQSHTFAELADAVAEMGADGVEATVRNGGHIEPVKAADQVPQMVEALAKQGKRLLIAASDVNQVSPDTERLLHALKDNGVVYYRMGYLKYVPGTEPLAQVRNFAAKAKELNDLNRELGLVGLYQNHAGKDNVGNLVWDLAILLEGIPPEHLGVALDLRHLRAEIGGSYQAAVEAIRPNLRSVYLKDTKRIGDNGDKLQEVPLGQGMVNRELFRDAWQSIKPAPLAVHVEYFGQKPIPVSKAAPVIAAYKDDIATLRSWMS